MSKVTTPEFRVSFPNVFEAKLNNLNGKMEFSIVALFKKGEDLSGTIAATEKVMIEKWGEDKAMWPKGLRSPFRDQGERAKNVEGKMVLPQGYEAGAIFLNLKSKVRPGVVDQNVQPMLDSSDFYAGCYARASLSCYAYDQAGNRGVSFGLGNIQKMKDGDPMGGRTRAEDDFAPVATAQSGSSASSLFE